VTRRSETVVATGREFTIYVLCGMAAVTTDFLIYVGLLHLGTGYGVAYFSGYAVGTLLSFALNRSITFRVHDAVLRRLVTFFGVAAIGYVTSFIALYLMIELGGLGEILAKVLSLGVVLVTQFLLNKLITFSKG
jgi:putative flippase GtrA